MNLDPPVRVQLVCSGDATLRTGGGTYNQQLVEAASNHGFVMEPVTPSEFDPGSTDIVVIDSLDASRMLSAMFRPRRRPPAVALVHQHPGGVDGPRWARRLRSAADLATYRRCDLVVPTGRVLADQLVRHRIDARRVRVVEPGTDRPAPAAPATQATVRDGRLLGLVTVANWWPNKGIAELVEAVARLAPDRATLHLVGRTDVAPSYEAALRRRLALPDLAGRVQVHGPLDPGAVADLLAGADAFAFPSHIESYGMAAAEAVAAGLPVIGWDLPFLHRLVGHGVSGLLAEPFDVAALSRAVDRLAVDHQFRRALAVGARRRRTALPTWADATGRFYRALRELVPGRGRGAMSATVTLGPPTGPYRRTG